MPSFSFFRAKKVICTKATIEHEDEEVKSLKIKYFNTVPTASSLCILKSGFLFVASEFGNQCVHFLRFD